MSQLVTQHIAANGGAELDPHQRKFNRLLGQVDKMRQELARWDSESAHFATAHTQLVRPLRDEFNRLRLDLLRQLDGLLRQRGNWTKKEAALLTDLLLGNAAALAYDEGLTQEQRDACRALYDAHAPQSLEDADREALEDMRGLFETASGLDLGDDDIQTEQDLMQRIHQRMTEEAAAEQQRQEQQQQAAAARKRKPSKAAQARAAREQAEAEAASASIREVFRKLAGALHPDRASDDADRELRTQRMQRANQAYAANDLLGLLSLQLEIEQIDAEHAARVTSQRARQLNGLLAEQLKELQQELLGRQASFAMGFQLDPMERVQTSALSPLLKRLRQHAELDLIDLRQDLRQLQGDKPQVKRWLKIARAQRDAAVFDDDFCPF